VADGDRRRHFVGVSLGCVLGRRGGTVSLSALPVPPDAGVAAPLVAPALASLGCSVAVVPLCCPVVA
jgi:hypothetical protein